MKTTFAQRRLVNPFLVNERDGRDMQYCSVDDRSHTLKTFTAAQCVAALKLPNVQGTVRKALARRARVLGERACRKCGCTEAAACKGGCAWASIDLCTACAPTARNRGTP